jgi:hypothetical protein
LRMTDVALHRINSFASEPDNDSSPGNVAPHEHASLCFAEEI